MKPDERIARLSVEIDALTEERRRLSRLRTGLQVAVMVGGLVLGAFLMVWMAYY